MDFTHIDDKFIQDAEAFKVGWEAAGRHGAVSPELSCALQKHQGIHPDQVEAYMQALMGSKIGKCPTPDPKNYQTRVVIAFRPR
jgi:hypothetical protein